MDPQHMLIIPVISLSLPDLLFLDTRNNLPTIKLSLTSIFIYKNLNMEHKERLLLCFLITLPKYLSPICHDTEVRYVFKVR